MVTDRIRERLVRGATGPFAHAPYPLARTLDHRGDPGLFGPGSVTWRVMGDPAAFVGGIRALLIQSAHPEVVAGVVDHSSYRTDPLGRLSRTSAYVTATSYGAMAEVAAAVAAVRRAHRVVRGRSHRGRPYSASDPALAAWVHNALTDSFLVAYRVFGPEPLTDDEADRFVAEQAQIGRLLGAEPLPESAAALSAWIRDHRAVAASPGMAEAVGFLCHPPLSGGQRAGYRVLLEGAIGTLEPRIGEVLGLRRRRGSRVACRLAVRALRWGLGSSPSWHLALVRTGAPIPSGRFSQPLPVGRLGSTGRSVRP